MSIDTGTFVQILGTVASNFQSQIAQKFLPYDPWVALIPREQFPDGVGSTLSYFKTEVTFATDETTWQPLSQNSDTAPNQTSLPGDFVNTAQTILNAPLEEKAVNSQDIDLVKTGMAFQFEEQLINTLTNFERAIGRIWSLYGQSRYELYCGNKIVCSPGLPSVASAGQSFISAINAGSGPFPQYKLTQGILDTVYNQLTYKNADMDGAYGEVDGAPVFLLMSDQQTLRNLIKANPDTRQDYRFADPGELLKPMGVGRVYSGFYHFSLKNQPRYNIVNNQLVPVPQYISVPATNGFKQVYNIAWGYAEIGVSYVFHRGVLKIMVPNWQSNLGSKVAFLPQNYMGDVIFRLYGIATNNRDGDVGFYRSKMIAAAKPVFSEMGYAILHSLCTSDDLQLTGCVGSS